jgi:hypothetical protein
MAPLLLAISYGAAWKAGETGMWKRRALYVVAACLTLAAFYWLFHWLSPADLVHYQRQVGEPAGALALAIVLLVLAQSAALFGFGLLAGWLGSRCK